MEPNFAEVGAEVDPDLGFRTILKGTGAGSESGKAGMDSLAGATGGAIVVGTLLGGAVVE